MLAIGPAFCLTQACEAARDDDSRPASASLEAQWGIQIESLRLSAGGHMIDFRYRVLDPEKAAALAKRENKPCLIDEATGATFVVPRTPKIGPLRQTAQRLTAGKVYWMFFSNPGKFIKLGAKVTVVIGDFRAEHLEVQ